MLNYGRNTNGRVTDDQGRAQRDLRAVDMSNWGHPEVDESSQSFGSEDFSPIRGQLPRWQPGEFAEWKMGKMTGQGTQYGRNRQMQYDMRNIPGMFQQLQNGMANSQRVAAGQVGMQNPAIMALLRGGIR